MEHIVRGLAYMEHIVRGLACPTNQHFGVPASQMTLGDLCRFQADTTMPDRWEGARADQIRATILLQQPYMEHIVEARFRRQLQLVHVPIEPPRANILNGQKNLGLACRESGRVWRLPGDAAAAAIPTAQPQTPCRGGGDRSMTCISVVPAPDAHEFQPGTHHVLNAAGGRWADVLPPVCMSAQRGITPVHNFER
jgi:hypothetical protein